MDSHHDIRRNEMASKPTVPITIRKPRITGVQKAWAVTYKEVREVGKDWATFDPLDAYSTKPEADAKAATNPTRP
jgi:hypothetical protein